MEYVHAFWVGGLICAAVQILMDRTKLMPGRIMVLLVCSGAVLGFLNIYGPFQKFAGAGASVPLLGFGNVLWNGVKEAVEKNGFLGIFMGGFKASAVGISAALIFGYLASHISDCRDSICKQKDTNESYRQYRSTGGYQEYSLHEFFSPCF